MDTEEKIKFEKEIIRSNYLRICDGIAESAYKAGRAEGSVRLIGVTKFVETERILPAIEAGLTDVGENRAQELVDKFDFFSQCGVARHFIGTLQTNKVKYLIGRADVIQSVDREPLVSEINRIACKAGLIQRVLIEVNIGNEEQKAGIAPGALRTLLESISALPNIHVEGLMCIPPAGNEDEARPYFARMNELFLKMKELKLPNIDMNELSMGMSGDYKAAVAEGATMVRVGSAIFGARRYDL